jgi:hypothetical protein
MKYYTTIDILKNRRVAQSFYSHLRWKRWSPGTKIPLTEFGPAVLDLSSSVIRGPRARNRYRLFHFLCVDLLPLNKDFRAFHDALHQHMIGLISDQERDQAFKIFNQATRDCQDRGLLLHFLKRQRGSSRMTNHYLVSTPKHIRQCALMLGPVGSIAYAQARVDQYELFKEVFC